MSVEFDRGSPGKFDSRTLSRETLNRWTGRIRPPSVLIILQHIISYYTIRINYITVCLNMIVYHIVLPISYVGGLGVI